MFDISIYGIQLKIHQQLIRKFRKVGAISEETAVSIECANLNLQEQSWLDYFAGSFPGSIKKTKSHLYYLNNYTNNTKV